MTTNNIKARIIRTEWKTLPKANGYGTLYVEYHVDEGVFRPQVCIRNTCKNTITVNNYEVPYLGAACIYDAPANVSKCYTGNVFLKIGFPEGGRYTFRLEILGNGKLLDHRTFTVDLGESEPKFSIVKAIFITDQGDRVICNGTSNTITSSKLDFNISVKNTGGSGSGFVEIVDAWSGKILSKKEIYLKNNETYEWRGSINNITNKIGIMIRTGYDRKFCFNVEPPTKQPPHTPPPTTPSQQNNLITMLLISGAVISVASLTLYYVIKR